eukprot:CAMPEP_0180404144 /NCGR_PEP_ID=MMETSP0989-20121125/39825_1 /TAXON_ID=697907 /ORGANISM="non described non described, Strain CCMP2293" /LENGTH=282 /DNA_ID=CAMNT_0022407473 /DNA_START=77 /DNA_END=925 /DNA_ORIENTATION=+
MKLMVQLENGELKETIAKSSDSMSSVRSKIEEQLGIPQDRQRLWFGGNELRDAPTLAHALWEALKGPSHKGDAASFSRRMDIQKIREMCSPQPSPRNSPRRFGGNSPLTMSRNGSIEAGLDGHRATARSKQGSTGWSSTDRRKLQLAQHKLGHRQRASALSRTERGLFRGGVRLAALNNFNGRVGFSPPLLSSPREGSISPVHGMRDKREDSPDPAKRDGAPEAGEPPKVEKPRSDFIMSEETKVTENAVKAAAAEAAEAKVEANPEAGTNPGGGEQGSLCF